MEVTYFARSVVTHIPSKNRTALFLSRPRVIRFRVGVREGEDSVLSFNEGMELSESFTGRPYPYYWAGCQLRPVITHFGT